MERFEDSARAALPLLPREDLSSINTALGVKENPVSALGFLYCSSAAPYRPGRL